VTHLAHLTDVRAPELACRYLRANLDALRSTQPELVTLVEAETSRGTFLFARDGSLTAQDATGRWAAGCSLPRRAAQAMLESLQNRAPVACFLDPSHAAQLAVVLERFERPQAVIAIVSDMATLRFTLECHNFSDDLADRRLWFAAGTDWSDRLTQLMRRHEGLAIPSAFIRLPILSEEVAETEIRIAREVFAAETARRAQRAAAVKETWRLTRSGPSRPTEGRVCVVAPSHFRLWDDAGWLLGQGLRDDSHFIAFDPDQPTTASPLAFATAACAADAVLAAGVFRADVPDVVPADLPWITLVTGPRLAPPAAAATRDRLILTDATLQATATKLGWQRAQVTVAGWPALPRAGDMDAPAAPLTLIANTSPIEKPPEPLDLSSHQLLWDLVRNEITANPLIVGNDISHYLDTRRQRLDIGTEGFDRALFIDRLIVPAYQQAIARLLVRSQIPLHIHGAGWDCIAELAAHVRDVVSTRDTFLHIVRSASALLHAWPIHGPHPIDACGRPVVRSFGTSADQLLRLAAQPATAPTPTPQPLSPDLIRNLLA
jgi:hypothetical protein